MARYRLTHAAQADIVSIRAWSHDQFGDQARKRYEALITTAIRDVATRGDEVGRTVRPELGDGVFSWHLAQSRTRSPGGKVQRPLARRTDVASPASLAVAQTPHTAAPSRRRSGYVLRLCSFALYLSAAHDVPTTSPIERRYLGVQGRGTIALPADVRRRLHLDEPGAQVEMTERADGVIELRGSAPTRQSAPTA